MKYLYPTIFVFCLMMVFVSCKNDKNEDPVSEPIEETIEVMDTIPKTRTLTVEDRNVQSSILTNMMLTIEAKNFVSLMVSAGLTNRLFQESGPFTVFAPSYIAFDNVPKDKMKILLDYKNKKTLATLINTHIIEGLMDTTKLKEAINNNGGNYTLKTISGATLTASLSGNDIVIKDKNGLVAHLEESDVICLNGVFHMIDTVLALD